MRRRASVSASIDTQLGARLRQRRTMMGLSLDQLAQRVGCTRQQMLNYEQAINRIPATRLFLCARELGVPLDFFFQDFGGLPIADNPGKRVTLALVRAFNDITDPKHRTALAKLVQRLGKDGTSSD